MTVEFIGVVLRLNVVSAFVYNRKRTQTITDVVVIADL